jgi:LuxR family maltose regulon positive regulatory protein
MLRAFMCAAGQEQMMADATTAVEQEPPWSPWRDCALCTLAEARLLAGQLDEARALFAEASAIAVQLGHFSTIAACESQLAWHDMDRGEWREAAGRLKLALATIEHRRLHDYVFCSLAFAGAARLSVHQGDLNEARRQLVRGMRARSSATYLVPFLAVRLRLHLAKVHLALADVAEARHLLREIDDILIHRPVLGTLIDEVRDFRAVFAAGGATEVTGTLPLTPAELRLLPYLQTHLTTEMIAEQLFISSHTVKTEVKAIYRKLGVSSRNEAVRKAVAIGLLGG